MLRRKNVEEVEGEVEWELDGGLDGEDVGNFSSHDITWDQTVERGEESDDDWNEDNPAS